MGGQADMVGFVHYTFSVSAGALAGRVDLMARMRRNDFSRSDQREECGHEHHDGNVYRGEGRNQDMQDRWRWLARRVDGILWPFEQGEIGPDLFGTPA